MEELALKPSEPIKPSDNTYAVAKEYYKPTWAEFQYLNNQVQYFNDQQNGAGNNTRDLYQVPKGYTFYIIFFSQDVMTNGDTSIVYNDFFLRDKNNQTITRINLCPGDTGPGANVETNNIAISLNLPIRVHETEKIATEFAGKTDSGFSSHIAVHGFLVPNHT